MGTTHCRDHSNPSAKQTEQWPTGSDIWHKHHTLSRSTGPRLVHSEGRHMHATRAVQPFTDSLTEYAHAVSAVNAYHSGQRKPQQGSGPHFKLQNRNQAISTGGGTEWVSKPPVVLPATGRDEQSALNRCIRTRHSSPLKMTTYMHACNDAGFGAPCLKCMPYAI